MCGIAGLFFTDPRMHVSASLIDRAMDTMIHRGPDDSGNYCRGNIGLGHRRLSVIDVAGGKQPLFNESKTIVLVCNGEIYNYGEIREFLVSKGHVFVTKSDSEVVVHAYEEWGVDCLDHFNGMFAFALWDERKDFLWLVRDRLGIKPLYYAWDKGRCVFASEIKAVLCAGELSAQLNENVLDSYFTLGYVPNPETMFLGITKVRPGHYVSIEKGVLTETEYWDLTRVEAVDASYEEAESRFESLLYDSVKKRLVSDVPVGSFLSGGIDSSSIVGYADKAGLHPNKTFTVGYDEKYGVSETFYAEIVADTFKTDHHVCTIESGNFFDSIRTLVECAEEPIAAASAIAMYHVSRLAKKHATVLLSGEGSDELLGGYYVYDLMQKIESVRAVVPQSLLHVGAHVLRKRSPLLSEWLTLPFNERFQGTTTFTALSRKRDLFQASYLTQGCKSQLYSAPFMETKGSYLEDTFSALLTNVHDSQDLLQTMSYIDIKTWLVDYLLLKADKMTMASSIELRVPFLDHRLVEFLVACPASYKVSRGRRKCLLKGAMSAILPQKIVQREKGPFPVPTQAWFQGEIFGKVERLLVERSSELPWFKRAEINRLLYELREGIRDHSKIVLMLVVLLFWKDRFINN